MRKLLWTRRLHPCGLLFDSWLDRLCSSVNSVTELENVCILPSSTTQCGRYVELPHTESHEFPRSDHVSNTQIGAWLHRNLSTGIDFYCFSSTYLMIQARWQRQQFTQTVSVSTNSRRSVETPNRPTKCVGTDEIQDMERWDSCWACNSRSSKRCASGGIVP
jgi:hypothetical protein